MRVKVMPADWGGCGWYRLISPALALFAARYDVHLDTSGLTVNWDREWKPADRAGNPPADVKMMGLHTVPDADVLVWQRPGKKWLAEVIPELQSHGIRIVVDIDDALGYIPRRNSAFKAFQSVRDRAHLGLDHVIRCCQQADLVTTTTPELADMYGFGHGVVLPNLVPRDYLSIDVPKLDHALGWAGNVDTHPGDLESTGGAVASAMQGTPWTFQVIGPGHGVKDALRLRQEPDTTGWVRIHEYPYVLSQLSAGICPVNDHPFNVTGKSWLKAAEMAAVGVPFVATDQGDYARMCRRYGVGLLARSRGQWQRQLRRLLTDDSFRADQAASNRAVMEKLTYEAHADRWWEAWTVTSRRSSRR